MKVYDKQSTVPIVWGVVFIHFLVLVLCIFFVYRFLIRSFNPDVFVLLALLTGGILVVDILMYRIQAVRRCFLRCELDSKGIRCYGFSWKTWSIPWDEVRTYGVTGYSAKNQPYAIVFFSCNANETYSIKQITLINNRRIVIQVREKSLEAFRMHLPQDIKKRLFNSIKAEQDCFYRR